MGYAEDSEVWTHILNMCFYIYKRSSMFKTKPIDTFTIIFVVIIVPQNIKHSSCHISIQSMVSCHS